MSCPSGGRLSTSPRSIWAFCTACILVLMVPIRACCAELYNTQENTQNGGIVFLKNLSKEKKSQSILFVETSHKTG